MTALRVDLEGGYVAFIVSHELLPEDVRRSVANDEEAREEARSVFGEKRDDRPGAESGKSRDSSPSARGSLRAGGGGSDSNASGASDDTKELATAADGTGPEKESNGNRARNVALGVSAFSQTKSYSRLRPLWVIVQSDQMETQHDSALQTPVPAPDVQPTRGILRHRHSKPLPPRREGDSSEVPLGLGMGAASDVLVSVDRHGFASAIPERVMEAMDGGGPLVVDAGGHVVRRAAGSKALEDARLAMEARDGVGSATERRVSKRRRGARGADVAAAAPGGLVAVPRDPRG